MTVLLLRLFGAIGRPLGQHFDAEERIPTRDIECPPIRSAKRKIRGILWHADCSKVLAAPIDDLNSGTRGYVQPALGVYRHAISSAPQRSIGTRLRVVQLHERPPVLSGTVWLDVERPEILGVGIGHKQDFSVKAQADTVWSRDLIVDERQIPLRGEVVHEPRRFFGWLGLACEGERCGIGEVNSA